MLVEEKTDLNIFVIVVEFDLITSFCEDLMEGWNHSMCFYFEKHERRRRGCREVL